MYCIMTDSRENERQCVGLVDRTKTKRKWWTATEVKLLIVFRDKAAADRHCRKYKHNNPRVVSYQEAFDTLRYQDTPDFKTDGENFLNEEYDGCVEWDVANPRM